MLNARAADAGILAGGRVVAGDSRQSRAETPSLLGGDADARRIWARASAAAWLRAPHRRGAAANRRIGARGSAVAAYTCALAALRSGPLPRRAFPPLERRPRRRAALKSALAMAQLRARISGPVRPGGGR